jgi:hypothetical protein
VVKWCPDVSDRRTKRRFRCPVDLHQQKESTDHVALLTYTPLYTTTHYTAYQPIAVDDRTAIDRLNKLLDKDSSDQTLGRRRVSHPYPCPLPHAHKSESTVQAGIPPKRF